jgi:pimeloyl-ACP methyl ester carboxylesterase
MPLALKLLIGIAVGLALLWALAQVRARAHEARAEAAFPPVGEILSVDGHEVHALVMGDGPDLVLIHGSSGNLRDWTLDLAPALARDYRVIMIDRPGLGYTGRINRTGATITQQAALLQKTAALLGAQKPIVLGHSYGGAVALAWAVHHPDNMSALVALSAASHPWETGLSTYYRVLSHPLLGRLVIPLITAFVPDERVEQAVAEVFAPDPVPDGYLAHFGAGLTLRRDSLRANALQRANLLDEIEALAPRYPQIEAPTEIVHGSADTTVGLSIHSEPLARAIPGARLTPLPDTGHMPHHAEPQAVIDAIHRAATRARLR